MATKAATKRRPDLSGLTAVLDCRSYEWLREEDPDLLVEIEAAMGQGAYPGEIGYCYSRPLPPMLSCARAFKTSVAVSLYSAPGI